MVTNVCNSHLTRSRSCFQQPLAFAANGFEERFCPGVELALRAAIRGLRRILPDWGIALVRFLACNFPLQPRQRKTRGEQVVARFLKWSVLGDVMGYSWTGLPSAGFAGTGWNEPDIFHRPTPLLVVVRANLAPSAGVSGKMKLPEVAHFMNQGR